MLESEAEAVEAVVGVSYLYICNVDSRNVDLRVNNLYSCIKLIFPRLHGYGPQKWHHYIQESALISSIVFPTDHEYNNRPGCLHVFIFLKHPIV